MPNWHAPLTQLTHKNAQFQWNEARQDAFDALRNCLISDDVLRFPDVTKPYELFCDASSSCIGSCLVQRDENNDPHPIYYISHQLDKSKCKWSTTEQEAYAILYSLNKLRPIIYGCPVTVFTDHSACKALESGSVKNTKLQRWALIIADYNAKITYLPGKKNSLADFLSRHVTRPNHECNAINTNAIPPPQRRDSLASSTASEPSTDEDIPELSNTPNQPPLNIAEHQPNDPKLRELIHLLHTDPENEKVQSYAIIDDTLYYLDDSERPRVVLPKFLLPQVIKQAHEGFITSHLGFQKTIDTLDRKYYCKGMNAATKKYVLSCHICAAANTRAQRIPIQEIKIPPHPFHTIAIDLCGPFEQSASGNRYVITVIDTLTHYIEATPSPDKTAASVASFLVDEIIPRHSTPNVLVSDNGAEFVNDTISYITDSLKIHHIRTSTYNPQGNSQVERSHRLLTDTLSKFASKSPENWDKYVKNYVGSHNCSSNYTKYSPFYLLYHRLPTFPLDTLLAPRDIFYGESFGPHLVEKMHRVFTKVRKQTKESCRKNRIRHNATSSFDPLDVGDLVYRKNTTRKSKLDTRWHPEPHIIVKKNKEHSFTVQNQLTNKTYRLHQRKLKKASTADAWLRPKPKQPPAVNTRPRRRTRNAASSSSEEPESSSEHSSSADSDNDPDNLPVNTQINQQPTPHIANSNRPEPVHFPSPTTYSQPAGYTPPISTPSYLSQPPASAAVHPPSPIFAPTPVYFPSTPIAPRSFSQAHPDPIHFPSPPAPSRSFSQARPDPVHMPTQTPPSNKRRLSASSDDGMDHDDAIGDHKKSRLFSVKSKQGPLSSIMALFTTG